jgi:hypothetical protein
MPDDEALFLDALYLGVRDVTSFDRALNLLCRLFDVQSATLLDFDAARPEVSHHASVGVLSGEILRRYERDFAALDPAPAAFIKQPAGTAIPTYRLLPEETKRPGVFLPSSSGQPDWRNVSGAPWRRPMGASPWLGCKEHRSVKSSTTRISPGWSG